MAPALLYQSSVPAICSGRRKGTLPLAQPPPSLLSTAAYVKAHCPSCNTNHPSQTPMCVQRPVALCTALAIPGRSASGWRACTAREEYIRGSRARSNYIISEEGVMLTVRDIRGGRCPAASQGEGRDRPGIEWSPAAMATEELEREVPGANLWVGKHSSRRRGWVTGY